MPHSYTSRLITLRLLMHYLRTLLITGGAGFIGSHVVRLLTNKYPQYHIICLDKLTYAGNLKTMYDVATI